MKKIGYLPGFIKVAGIKNPWNNTGKTNRGSWDEGIQREDDVKTQGEDSRLLGKKRGLEKILPLQPSEGINTAAVLISNSQPPELWDNKFMSESLIL